MRGGKASFNLIVKLTFDFASGNFVYKQHWHSPVRLQDNMEQAKQQNTDICMLCIIKEKNQYTVIVQKRYLLQAERSKTRVAKEGS